MDSITQAALGAALGGSVMGKHLGRWALLSGALLGTVPDLDVLIDYGDAVSNFTQHRGFSHSILVLTPFALLLAWVFQRWRPAISYGRWATFTVLILVTHPLLDAFTTYGTQLLWPFAGPFGLTSIFIIDPFYTVPLLIACAVAAVRPQARRALSVGLMVSTTYLGWSLVGQHLITQRALPALADHGIQDAPRLVQPMPFTTILWRITVLTETRQVELVTGFLDANVPLQLEFFPRSPPLEEAARQIPAGSRLHAFTEGFLSFEVVDDRLTATDIRLGLPGAHPFMFALARRDMEQWVPVSSYLLPRASLDPGVWRPLLSRILGQVRALNQDY